MSKKNKYEKTTFAESNGIKIQQEDILTYEDKDVIRIKTYSLFPPEYPQEKSLMNEYGQKILNSLTNYDENVIKSKAKKN